MRLISDLQWQKGELPSDMNEELSPAEFEFAKSHSTAIKIHEGLDLIIDALPPRDPEVTVRVLQDLGNIRFRTGSASLSKGSVHVLPGDEAARFINQGYFENVDIQRE